MFPLSNFPFTDPCPILGYTFPLFLIVFGVEPDLSPPLQNLIPVLPTPTEMVQKSALLFLTSVMNRFCEHSLGFLSNFAENTLPS